MLQVAKLSANAIMNGSNYIQVAESSSAFLIKSDPCERFNWQEHKEEELEESTANMVGLTSEGFAAPPAWRPCTGRSPPSSAHCDSMQTMSRHEGLTRAKCQTLSCNLSWITLLTLLTLGSLPRTHWDPSPPHPTPRQTLGLVQCPGCC